MKMKVLFIGDVVGNAGRQMIEDYLYRIRKDYQIDFVIANVENATHGKGLNRKHYDFFTFEGVDCMTMGNHTFDKKELFDFIDEADRLVVPYNQPRVLPGVSSRVFNVKGTKIRVTNALGCVFMDNRYSNPFDHIDDYLNLEQDIHIIDIHAEATSEKIGLAYYCRDKVQAVLGTHTHVQTADERIIDGQRSHCRRRHDGRRAGGGRLSGNTLHRGFGNRSQKKSRSYPCGMVGQRKISHGGCRRSRLHRRQSFGNHETGWFKCGVRPLDELELYRR